MSTDIELGSADLWLEQAVGHPIDGTLSKIDALALTAKIKAYTGVTWILIHAAYEHQAHKALGYKTWEAYVAKEFDMSRSYSYRLISQATVVLEISAAVNLSPMGDISERTARELAKDLPAAKAKAIEVVEALPEDATDAEKEAALVDALRTPSPGVDANGEIQDPSGSDQDEDRPLSDAAGPGDDGQEREPAPNPAPKVAPLTLITLWGNVEDWVRYEHHNQAIDQLDPEARADYRAFLLRVFEHVNAALDHLDRSSVQVAS